MNEQPPVDPAEIRDELPEDLDAAAFVGVYQFPDNKRRRIPATVYLLLGAGALALWAAAGDEAVFVNDGFAWVGAVLVLFGIYGWVAGKPILVDEKAALEAASRHIGFAVGHASGQMVWRGLLSRPTWRILVYSAEEPPAQRGLVLVDAVDGEIVSDFVEDNPEDWS